MAKSLLHTDATGPALLNLAGYAAHRKANGLRGQSHVAVWQAISTGRIVEPAVRKEGSHWLINAALADRQWAANTRSSHSISTSGLPSQSSEIVKPTWNQEIIEAKLKRARAIAEREELATQRQKGELLHVRDVCKRWEQNARALRDAFINLPARLSEQLADEAEPEKIKTILTVEIVSILQDFANA
jgi:hypothetical protein